MPQLLFSPRRDKDTFHITMPNLRLKPMNKETMLGLMLKKVIPTLKVGKLTSPLLELIILTLLKLQIRKSNLMKLKLHLLFKERSKSTQLVIALPTSPHTLKETMPGTMPSTTNPTR